MHRFKTAISHVLFFVIALGNHLIPKRKQILLHAYPSIEDQGIAVLRWLRDHPAARSPVVLLVSESESDARRKLKLVLGEYSDEVRIIEKNRPAAIFAYWRSKTVLYTHGLYGFFPGPPGQCIVNIWHGMPAKTIWKATVNSDVPNAKYLLSTSEKFSGILADCSGMAPEKILVTGLPRNDLLLNRTPNAVTLERELRNGGMKVMVYLPTYRKSESGYVTADGDDMGSTFCMGEDDVQALGAFLVENKIKLLVKPHPMSVHYGKDVVVNSNLWVISNEWLIDRGLVLYDLLAFSDAIITDTSSVYVDYLQTGRPCFCYFPDIDAYRKTRKFLLEPIEEWVPSDVYRNYAELKAALLKFAHGEDFYKERREKLRAVLNPGEGRTSACDRLFDLCARSK